MSIKENIEAVREKIAEAAKAAGRDPSSITLVGEPGSGNDREAGGERL